MATLSGTLIVNRKAPVTAWLRPDFKETRTFKNMSDFEDWYRPAFHGDAYRLVNSQYLFTDVPLESIDDPPKIVPTALKIKAPRVVGERPTPTKSRVTVDGVEYGSTWQAFQKLDLGDASACVKFRKELKIKGTLVFDHKGKKYQFSVMGV